ncbi:SRPBCC family protein [Kutzneria sp. 744]|uniref:SRPBCC family protein n=1 Tax=Kutzneria sp. (strain 744) TaxID=345341 RepID=UPI0003EED5FE|nr:SRPBCC family protein [Kutzneria sp. 744]EWM13674.1 multifunctional cyclase-dehydratase-3-O-methyl transferase TcmN [Kutzneria sp. 744]
MAVHITNEVLIGAPVDLTWRLANDIGHWPDLFGEYASVRLLHRDGAASRFQLTAPPDARGRVLTWILEQLSDPARRTVHARRIGPGPLEQLSVRWSCAGIGGVATRLCWIQDFATRPDTPIDDAAMMSHLDFGSSTRLDLLRRRIESVARAQRLAGGGG